MSDKRIDITELEKRFQDGLNWDDMDTMELIAELKRCYELIDELENPCHEDERYPEPDERTPPNTTRAGADWPSGPRM